MLEVYARMVKIEDSVDERLPATPAARWISWSARSSSTRARASTIDHRGQRLAVIVAMTLPIAAGLDLRLYFTINHETHYGHLAVVFGIMLAT